MRMLGRQARSCNDACILAGFFAHFVSHHHSSKPIFMTLANFFVPFFEAEEKIAMRCRELHFYFRAQWQL